MAPRTRTRQQTLFTGTLKGTFEYSRSVVSNLETCSDVVGPGHNKALTIDKYYHKGAIPRANGTYLRFGSLYTATDYPPGIVNSPTERLTTYRLPVVGSPSDAAAAAKIAKMTNPSRPLVDLPVFIFELRELPNLLLQRSRDIGADIARGRLSAEFGWKPLIRDLVGLASIHSAFRDRVDEINNLRKSGLRRKRVLFRGSSRSADEVHALSNDAGLVTMGRLTTTTTEVVTGWIKWSPQQEIPHHLGLRNDLAEQKALFALLGLNPYVIDAATIWEILPYSWLADWCTNMGDLVAANRNNVGAVIDKILIMRHRKTIQKCVVSAGGTAADQLNWQNLVWNTKEFYRIYETKSRIPASLELEAHMPFLSTGQVAILADIVRGNLPGKIRRR